jgi:sugar phosphate isomerase/epimerase
MQRRTFIQMLGSAAAGLSLPRRAFAAGRLDRIGLELYSVRRAMRADPERTLAAVRAIGYTDVELLWSFGNFGRTTAQVRASLDHEGLRAPSAHINPDMLTDQGTWAKALEDAATLGQQYLIVPSLPADAERSLDGWRSWADRFNTAGVAARRANLWLAFHNEPTHMTPINGSVPYDLFLERLDPTAVRLQLDVGNMRIGGGDPMQYLARHQNWYWSFHLKDVAADGTHDTELGTGTFDFKRFLAAVPDLPSKPCYVEQEEPRDEMASARQNYGFLRNLTFD